MLRRFAAPSRQTGEDWVHWIRRATKIAEANATAAGIKSWVQQHLEAKWRWAGHIARMGNYRKESWAFKATFWRGYAWRVENAFGSEFFSSRPLRSRAGRWSRWEDQIATFCASIGEENWMMLANDKEEWEGKRTEFAAFTWK